MELTAIYHRPESEYAYLYKDDQLHIRIGPRKKISNGLSCTTGIPLFL